MQCRVCVETVRLGMSCEVHSSTARLTCQKKCAVRTCLYFGLLLRRAGSIACIYGHCHMGTDRCAPLWDGPSSPQTESAASGVRVAAQRAATPPFEWCMGGSA